MENNIQKKKKHSRYFDNLVTSEVEDAVLKVDKKEDPSVNDNIQTFNIDLSLLQRKQQEGQSKKDKSVDKRHPGSEEHDRKQIIHDLSEADFSSVHKTKGKRKSHSVLKKGKIDKKKLRDNDPFPGDAPISRDKIKKYKRGQRVGTETIRTKFHQSKIKAQEIKFKEASKTAARSELLLQEEPGYLEADDGELTCEVSQHDIAKAVDITSAQKFFELKLDKFGPYRMNYTRNGRHLLLGGGKGHIAAIDWQTKKLMCEVNVMETVQDVKWLHIETMFAVAQKQWTYVYDNQGIELHCLKSIDHALRLEFLPYHFLLVAATAKSYITWLDVSIGQKVAGYTTGLGRLDVMCQNPSNAIIHMGHSGGTVTLWSPNIKEPLVKMLCHGGGTRSITVHKNGNYMATSGIDRTLKIWDLRTYKQLHSCKIGAGAGSLSFSQQGLLAAGIGNIVEVYKDPTRQAIVEPYMSHRLPSSVQNLQFCPYEDVLGVGHSQGFASLLIPGAGEPNFDALEANPYQSKKQRQQAEVKMLLEKVQPEMISLDTSALEKVDTKTLLEVMEEKKKLMYVKPQKIDFEPKYKKKGKSKAGKVEKRKKGVQFEHKREQIKEFIKVKQAETKEREEKKPVGSYNVMDRFKKSDF